MPAGPRYGVELRSAQVADAADVTRLLAGSGAAVVPDAIADRLEAIRLHPAAAAVVATDYEGVCGLVVLHWAPQLDGAVLAATVTTLVVEEEKRRRGIGRLLLKAASQAARSHGCDAIALAVPLAGEAAGLFCLATGFSPAGASYVRLLRKRA